MSNLIFNDSDNSSSSKGFLGAYYHSTYQGNTFRKAETGPGRNFNNWVQIAHFKYPFPIATNIPAAISKTYRSRNEK
jgi:hypothetical protein